MLYPKKRRFMVIVSYVTELGLYEEHYFYHFADASDFYNDACQKYRKIDVGFVKFVDLLEVNENVKQR